MSEYEQSILPIVQGTWESILQLPVEEGDQTGGPLPYRYAGMVTISGAWDGAVGVYVTEKLGRRAANMMLAIDDAAVSAEDIKDALAELTNVIGGNLKALVPSPSLLGLPVVVEGTDYRLEISGRTETITRRFRCEQEDFEVVVIERVEAKVGA